ncbi:MurR/RpiR family transcriptional regulator [Peribacillus frigoritolerans]|uniref:MurR/RpiR family transcriptional regulator n=1 Tax=Peribacillus frigoritolerans TaxID=450367 RepID=UPI00399CFB7C
MMSLTLLQKINEKADSLSRAERQVAKYILDHADLVQTYTISEISTNANVSQASVVRFCKRMGIDSFKTFQHTLVKEMSSNNDNINDLSLLRENDTPYQLFQKVTMSNKFALDSLVQTLNKKEFEKAVECLSLAKKIAFFGVGGSSTAALDASNKFAKLGVTTGMNTDFHTVISYISNFTPEDVLVIFSTSGKTKDILEMASYAKKINVPVLAITAYTKSPLLKIASIQLCFPDIEHDHRIGSIASRIMQLNMVDALYLSVFHRIDKKTIDNYQKAREEILRLRR